MPRWFGLGGRDDGKGGLACREDARKELGDAKAAYPKQFDRISSLFFLPKEIVAAWQSMDGKQGGNPAKLAAAIVKLAALQDPPTRFAAGADAMQTFETKANTVLAQGQAHRELSTSLTYDDA
jgi:hypothetical protein